MLTVGELFAGIGGIGLGFERAGGGGEFGCAWQVENDEYANRVLRKHWPNVRRWDDVRTFPPGPADEWRVDVIAGGFPCQDISNAGRQAGIDGERSGLWGEFDRVIGVLSPRIVVVENVTAILVRGFGRVVGDLAARGYDAQWRVIPAGGPGGRGAPHRRERIFVVAYADGARLEGRRVFGQRAGKRAARSGVQKSDWSKPVADVLRMADGVSGRVDRTNRLRCLGNAVVPAVAQYVAESILEHEGEGETECWQ